MPKKFKIPSKKEKTPIHIFNFDDDIIVNSYQTSHLEIYSNKEITLDGCYGIYEYKDEYIKLKLHKGSISLCGKELIITTFENKIIKIKGKISSVEFCI